MGSHQTQRFGPIEFFCWLHFIVINKNSIEKEHSILTFLMFKHEKNQNSVQVVQCLYLTEPLKRTGSWGMIVSWDRSCSRSREAMLSWSISTLPPDSSTSRNRAVTSELLPDPVRPTIPVPKTQNYINMTMLYLLHMFVSCFMFCFGTYFGNKTKIEIW